MGDKIHQGPNAIKVKQMAPGDTWLGSAAGTSVDPGGPYNDDANQALVRALDTPDVRSPGTPLHRKGGLVGRYNQGGMVKHGSPKVSAPCRDTKTVKC